MSTALTEQEIAIVKGSIPLLESAGSAITEHFYQRLFTHHPELKHIFNMSNQHSGKQQFALFNAIAAYAKYVDNLPALTSAVERIANKHTSLNIQAEHYPIVGKHLLATLQELAPDAFTEEVTQAWAAAYQQLADVLISVENTLYQQKNNALGGWKGGRQFRLIEKKIESELVKSLTFAPTDGGAVMGYQAGQYIGIDITLPQREYRERRQYSLSDTANGNTYRISVKREIIGTPGVVSNYLHDSLRLGDEVTLYPPAGDFCYQEKTTPVVLISAGVGLTPMQSILETLAKNTQENTHNHQCPDIYYLHACNNTNEHSFNQRVLALSHILPLQHHTWYANDESTSQYIHHGFMDISDIKDTLPLTNGDFYICGPVAFMQFAQQQLIALGVPSERIHYEVFGPHEAL
jgi:nitric oxide dioxygenase